LSLIVIICRRQSLTLKGDTRVSQSPTQHLSTSDSQEILSKTDMYLLQLRTQEASLFLQHDVNLLCIVD